MAKQNANATPAKVNGLTAATFSTNGKKGKPARPEGMSNQEWCKVLINIRVPKMLKAMEAVARLSTVAGFKDLPKTAARILNDMEANATIIRTAFANPKTGKAVAKTRKLYTA